METTGIIKMVFRDDSVSEVQINVWYRRFKDGQELIESDLYSGRPATSRTPKNVEHMQAAINENWRLTVRIRGKSGDSMECCFREFDGGSWHELCGGKIRFTAPVTRAEGIFC
jgi:hypothetical protein